MADFMVEIPHSPIECDLALPATSARAYSACPHGVHRTWLLVDVESESEAWELVPALLRDTARVVPLVAPKEAQ
jgi:hypothetical protein